MKFEVREKENKEKLKKRKLSGESKVLQYFGNMRDHVAVPDAFAEYIKVTNLPKLWDTELAWYSLSAILSFCQYCLEYGLRILGSRPLWLCLVVTVLATRRKFPELYVHCILKTELSPFGSPVGWGSRIHRVLLCWEVKSPPPTSVLDITLNNLMVRLQ